MKKSDTRYRPEQSPMRAHSLKYKKEESRTKSNLRPKKKELTKLNKTVAKYDFSPISEEIKNRKKQQQYSNKPLVLRNSTLASTDSLREDSEVKAINREKSKGTLDSVSNDQYI